MTIGIDEMTENEKAFAFYAYTLSLISTGLSPQEATVRARGGYDEAGVVNTVQSKLSDEPEYGEMIESAVNELLSIILPANYKTVKVNAGQFFSTMLSVVETQN